MTNGMALTRRAFIGAIPLMLAVPVRAATTALVRHDVPRKLPPLAFDTRAGDTVPLSSVRGDVTVLHLWATWCGSCRTEFPSLLQFQKAYSSRRVALVTVSVDRLGWPIIDRTLDELSARALPVFLDRNREIMAALGTYGLPTSLILTARGEEVARAPGPLDWMAPAVTAYIESLLAA
jgi:thiol-disulfide isomerase/thioredoxin